MRRKHLLSERKNLSKQVSADKRKILINARREPKSSNKKSFTLRINTIDEFAECAYLSMTPLCFLHLYYCYLFLDVTYFYLVLYQYCIVSIVFGSWRTLTPYRPPLSKCNG